MIEYAQKEKIKIMTKKVMQIVFSYVIIILIATVVALSYNLFVFPNKFAPAGRSGAGQFQKIRRQGQA